MKTLATVLATPLFSFYCYFISYCTFGCRFRPPEAAFFLSATATRSHILGPYPRPSRRCQPCLLRPNRTFQAQTRDQIAAVSFVCCAQIAPFRPEPATQSPLSALSAAPRSHLSVPNPRPSRRCQSCFLRSDRACKAETRDHFAAASLFSCAPTAFCPPTVAIRPRLFITQARSDRRCQPETRDLDRACFF